LVRILWQHYELTGGPFVGNINKSQHHLSFIVAAIDVCLPEVLFSQFVVWKIDDKIISSYTCGSLPTSHHIASLEAQLHF
jgi:hypothetical protein